MSISLRRTDDLTTVTALHMLTFPGDEFDLKGQLWLAHDESGTPVGFCAARKLKGENAVFLNRAGVLPCANGQRLQRRMILARLKWAKQIGAKHVITYVLYHNHASIVNLIKSGFRFYEPDYKWAGRDVHYFTRSL